jgi:ABC-type lipoprotein release transport system permease subunit
MLKYIKLAWRNMWRNWRRTAIATIAIVLGLILLVFMDALIAGSDQAIYGNSVRLYGGNIQVHAPGYRERASRQPLLPLENANLVLEKVLAQPDVVAASRRINTGGMVGGRGGAYPVVITAIEPEGEAPVSLIAESITQGRFLTSDDTDAVLIGRGLADLLGASVGDRVTVLGQRKDESMRQRTMTIVGIYDLGLAEAEKGSVFIPLSEAQTLYNLRGQETEVTVMLRNVGEEAAVVSNLQSELPGYEIDTWDTLRPEIQQTLEVKSAVTNVFGFIVLLIASIGILNLMLMAVFERTREMGVLAALGMKGRQILGLFLAEGAFIGLLGAIVGCFLAWLVVWSVAQVGIDFSFASDMGDITALMGDRLYPSVNILKIAGYGVGVVVIAALASLFPAWQASRKEPAESLHYI